MERDNEPHWLKHLSPVFWEANETISLSLSASDTSFVNERNESQDKNEGSSYSETENPAEYSEYEKKIDSFSLKLSSGQKQTMEVFYKNKVFLKIRKVQRKNTRVRVSFLINLHA